MKRKINGLVVLLMVVTLTTGCGIFSSEPDEETIQNAFLHCVNKSTQDWTVTDFKITNNYEKEINRENVFIYEAQFKIKHIASGTSLPEGEQLLSLTCGVVKRGNNWYAIR